MTKQWTDKYKRELQQLDEQINETKDVMIALKLKFDEMNENYCNREEEVRDYLEERTIREHANNLVERQYEAIVKIQAWWRGILVRRNLGPYRRKKVKKSKKSKGKKK